MLALCQQRGTAAARPDDRYSKPGLRPGSHVGDNGVLAMRLAMNRPALAELMASTGKDRKDPEVGAISA
jgi:hypothetical protein